MKPMTIRDPARAAGIALAAGLLAVSAMPDPAVADNARFNEKIYPIIEKYCVECHQPGCKGFEESGLDLTSYEGIMKGTKHGPIVVPGDAFRSNLNVLV